MKCLVVLCVVVLAENAYGQNFYWPLHSPVTNEIVGPTDAVYCQLKNPKGETTFEGFGRCVVNIERVTHGHHGWWQMDVNLPDNMLPENHGFHATVGSIASGSRQATTEVAVQQTVVTLTCRVPSDISACVFWTPAGVALHLREGVSEDRYSYVEHSERGTCSLQINGREEEDVGFWRCDLLASSDTHYGFLSVEDPNAEEASEPTLTSKTDELRALEGAGAMMSCSIPSAITYCYFRAPNGTLVNIRPGLPTPVAEYVGAGFDAGDCSARVRLGRSEGGAWTCHVGLRDSPTEHSAEFSVTVQGPIDVNLYDENPFIMVNGTVFTAEYLEYCRFVPSNGLGFKSDNLPDSRYQDYSRRNLGYCAIKIFRPTEEELLPWTVAAKISGSDVELSDSSLENRHEACPPVSVSCSISTWWVYLVVASAVVTAAAAVVVLVTVCKRTETDKA